MKKMNEKILAKIRQYDIPLVYTDILLFLELTGADISWFDISAMTPGRISIFGQVEGWYIELEFFGNGICYYYLDNATPNKGTFRIEVGQIPQSIIDRIKSKKPHIRKKDEH